MKKLSLTFGIALMLCSQLINAQEIFKQHGFTKESLTLSNGSYNEFFDNDEVVQIGTVLLNTRTNQLVRFIEEYTFKTKYKSEFSSRWISVDPLAQKYSQLSPYVYCANNPIIYIDPDGKKIVDAKGNMIFSQKGGWVKNASIDAQKIQSAVLTTSIGREQWNKMVKSANKINLSISDKNTFDGEDATLGTTFIPRSKDKETGKNKFRSDVVIKVVLYEKTITDKTLTSGQLNEGLTSQQALGATAAHEAEHATNQQNINDTVDNTNLAEGQEKHDVESLPNSIGNQAREEARMKPIVPKEVSRVSN